MKFSAPSFLLGMLAMVAAMVAVHFFARAMADTYLTVPFASYHMPQSEDRAKRYNEANVGIGFEQTITEDWRAAIGTYRNSLYRTSYYGGVSYLPIQAAGARLGTSIGLVSGYNAAVLPVVAPTAAIERNGIGINLVFIPPIPGRGVPGVIGLQLKWRL